jgi:hypothetical protein
MAAALTLQQQQQKDLVWLLLVGLHPLWHMILLLLLHLVELLVQVSLRHIELRCMLL